MKNLIWILIGLAALSFVLAAISATTKIYFLGVQPEGFSFACTNLALIAIALSLISKKNGD